MSQLPKCCKKSAKTVNTSTTRTTKIPGTSNTITQSTSGVTVVSACGKTSKVSTTDSQDAIPKAGTSGLRQPSGLRPPAGTQRRDPCAKSVCEASRPPARVAPGEPQVQVQGLTRPTSFPPPAQRRTVQQPGAGRLQQTRVTGMQQPRPTAMQQSRPVSQQQSARLQPPAQSRLRPPSTTSRVQQRTMPAAPTVSASRVAAPCQCSEDAEPAKPSGLRRPQSGPSRAPSQGLRQPSRPGGVRPPSLGLPRPTAPQAKIVVCDGGTCGAGAQAPQSRMPAAAARGVSSRQRVAHGRTVATSTQQSRAPPQGPRKTARETAEEKASKLLMRKAHERTGAKVTAKAATISSAAPEYIETPAGRERIIKQAVLEKRVERDEQGEKLLKNLQIVDLGTCPPKKTEMSLQQLDPEHPHEGKEIIAITSTISMTKTHATISQHVSRASTENIPEAAALPPEEVAKLVEEESEDVENTLRMLPPDLVLSPGRYEMKKRLQHLQMNSESVALLEQSITRPEPRADEAQAEPTPEVMAAMLHTVEKGVPPQSTPDQVFNSLFVETSNEHYIKLSPITEGPLQDVVVPTEVPLDVHKEAITNEMEQLTERLQNIPTAAELPVLDIFDQVMAAEKKSPTKGHNKEIKFPMIQDEKSLWVNANLEHLVNIVGAAPVEVLDPANINDLELSGQLEQEMASGVEYFVHADPVQYMSRVQLRGSQKPSYFPGYLVALPEFPDIVKLVSNPDQVFSSAWKATQPKYFPDDSLQTMSF